MKSTLSHSSVPTITLPYPACQTRQSGEAEGGLRVERIQRRGPLLVAGPFPGEANVLRLNITCGPQPAPGGVVVLYRDTASQLGHTLSSLPRVPRAVCINPGADPFLSPAEVQEETARVVSVLASHGVESWLLTRGRIRPAALEVLVKHREHVRVTVGLTTLDPFLQRSLEPLTATPTQRLQQVARLREQGVRVRAEVAPLIPGITDTRDNLRSLLEALVAVDVRQITAGYLVLRPGDELGLREALGSRSDEILAEYRFGVGPRYLSRTRRQRGYASLMALGTDLGVQVSVCRLSNPDFARGPVLSEPQTRLGLIARAWGRPNRDAV